MDKTKVKQRGLFMKLTRNKSRKEIKRIEEKTGKRLSREEKRKIMKKNAKKARIYTSLAVFSFLLGGVANNRVTNLLDKGKTEIAIDANQYKDGISINNVTNHRNVFLNGLHVDLDEISRNEELEQGVITEINSLENSDQVLEYIKKIYLNEYKQKNGGDVDIEDISLRKDRNVRLYRDVAQNGDEIVRRGISENNQTVNSEIGLLTAFVHDGDENYIENVIYDFGSYKNVYDENEIVSEDKQTILEDIGSIIENGIDYYSGFIDEEESEIYKQRLIDSVIEYKYSKIKEIIEPSTLENTDQPIDKGFEIDE